MSEGSLFRSDLVEEVFVKFKEDEFLIDFGDRKKQVN